VLDLSPNALTGDISDELGPLSGLQFLLPLGVAGDCSPRANQEDALKNSTRRGLERTRETLNY
jgi:hypothetical protein